MLNILKEWEDSVRTIINKFDTFEKCDAYRKAYEQRVHGIYWSMSDGILIRSSLIDDEMGDASLFTSIYLCDMIGCDGYSSTEHTYEFAVTLHKFKYHGSTERFTNIQDAIDSYIGYCKHVMLCTM